MGRRAPRPELSAARDHPPLPPLPSGEPHDERVGAWYAAFIDDYGPALKASDYPELHAVAALWEAFWMTFDKGIHAEVRAKLAELRLRLDERLRALPQTEVPLVDQLAERRSRTDAARSSSRRRKSR